jgi:nitrite reductase/ring-hydroxylating ferredoxin subunit
MPDITRRDFLKLMKGTGIALGAGALAAPVVSYFYPATLEIYPAEPALVCGQDELPVGESRTIPFGRYPAIVINTPNGLKAYSAACTHFACTVKWNNESGMIECPCHDGYFKVEDGSVISGPPPKPLLTLAIEIVDGKIYVKVSEA